MKIFTFLLLSISFLCFSVNEAKSSVIYPGKKPGASAVSNSGDGKNIFSLENDILKASWKLDDKHLSFQGLENKTLSPGAEGSKNNASSTELFRLSSEPGASMSDEVYNLPSSKFVLEGQPVITKIQADPKSPRLGDRFPGNMISATFKNEASGLTVKWKAELRDGASYIKQTYDIGASEPISLKKIQLVDIASEKGAAKGSVPGSPLVDESARIFAGIELPMAQTWVDGGRARMGFDCNFPMEKGASQTFTTVQGIYPEEQMRRGFLYYMERERATPYHQFLHYNGWYDDGLNPSEKTLIETAKAYKKELGGRNVKMEGFVLDDGWDDVDEDLWMPSTKKFPSGFSPVVQEIKKMPSSFGIWISPLGGYYGPEKRVQQAVNKGIIPPGTKEFDLSMPGYYKWFRDRCAQLMKEDGVNYFKWDKAGDGVSPHFMALLSIARELRKVNPSLFINTTVGTWPSPFWLNHVDCTWRSGSQDVGWQGKGDDREQWLTYRDASCYNIIVKQGPLYPLNSLMHHGIVLGKEFQAARVSKGADGKSDNKDLKNDSRIFFGAGANLQELYLTPSMMDAKAWDDVAAGAKWARKFQSILSDVHWIGGDPGKLEPYGYAAWSPQGATLALRNPDDTPKTIALDAKTVFEPVSGSPAVFSMKASYPDQRVKNLTLKQGESVNVELQPFEVLVFDVVFPKK